MTPVADTHVYVVSLGWVPKKSIGPDGQVLPLPPALGTQIRRVIEERFEQDPTVLEVWIREEEHKQAEKQRGAA